MKALLSGLAAVMACCAASAQNPDAINDVSTASKAYGRGEVNQQLRAISIPSLHFRQMRLSEVLENLAAQAKQSDFQFKAVNFVSRGLDDIEVTVDPPLKGLLLGEALEAVLRGAREPIRYRIENFGIVFQRHEQIMPQLYTRWFKLDREALQKKMPELLQGSPEKQTDALKQFLATRGVSLAPPRRAFFNARLGQFMVRATIGELDRIEVLFKEFRIAAERLQYELRFAEVPAPATPLLQPNLSLDASLTQPLPEDQFRIPSNKVNGIFSYQQLSFGGVSTNQSRATNHAAVVGTLTEAQFGAVVKALQQKAGVDLLTAPRMTALDSEPTLFRLGSQPLANPDTKLAFDDISIPVGPSVIVCSILAPDKKSLVLSVTGAVKEFMGYDLESSAMAGRGASTPVALYRLRQVSDEFGLQLGHTAVLSIGPVSHTKISVDKIPVIGDLPIVGRLFRTQTQSTVQKHLWFFITPVLPAF